MKTLFRSRMRFVLIPIIGLAFLFLVGYAVMMLWNYTLPALLGVSAITLWQAMALFFLCKILFGFSGGGPGKGRGAWKRRAMHRKFDRMSESDRAQMSEADKAQFKAYMRSRWCHWEGMAEAPEKKDSAENQ
ncbi:hypothetical protein [Parapedobacter sp. DT-150]|uniref:hypothetical protein n=1 Tax=Parapedobacter sp. DT-150 TaxID=3396162 RepID=UPI003F1CC35A